METFLNTKRPPLFCPGCTHERITKSLDSALLKLNLPQDKNVIVSDIGCSGLFDIFFNVHALHGLHGRALTYASGIKLANPELNVVVTMGDGGLGIGAAHLIAACRKNLNITLIILNNFNFGMTGGQYSLTTPSDAAVSSGFLNQAEIPIDICEVAKSSGAAWIARCSAYDRTLPDILYNAMQHKGFAIVETLGVCTGRYTKNNHLNIKMIDKMVEKLPQYKGEVEQNKRPEYGEQYRKLAAKQHFPELCKIEKKFDLQDTKRHEILILGSAGMGIITAGEILCNAAISAGLNASMKNDYNITVLRGQSVSEVIISSEKIGYSGIESPTVVLALSSEGVERKIKILAKLDASALLIKDKNVEIPDSYADIAEFDFKFFQIKQQDWALACLGLIAEKNIAITMEMLDFALKLRFKPESYGFKKDIIKKLTFI